MKTKLLLLIFFSIAVFSSNAREERNLLQRKADIEKLKSCLMPDRKWVSYPAYRDRKGWDALTVGLKEGLIKRGEAVLNYEWKVVKATDYLEYERSGSRQIMESPFDANNKALADLVMAELAEGKGRFMDQIANGVWHSCEMTSWALSAHVGREQKEKTSLPSYKEHIIDLTAGDLGSFLAWTYYFLKEEMDKVQPLIAERLRANLQDRVLDPYMNRSNFWWQAFNATPQTMVNNWNPWCNFNVLTCFLLLENDLDKLAKAVHRTMMSVDQFLNYVHEDGACEEGPSYWGHAAGKMYDYLQLLSYATGGKVSIFDQPMIKNMGEYIAKSYIGNGWVVNFADASAKGGGEPGLIFRYGKAVGSIGMQQFASNLYNREPNDGYINEGRDIFRTLENVVSHPLLKNTQPSLDETPAVWYPQTQFCYMRNKAGFFVAANGGHNDESHNHNDVGSFMLYYNGNPLFIDIGVGTYTRQTFSSERYSIWTMQSNYHNLPVINGVAQSYGRKFCASEVAFNAKKRNFTLNIANAYNEKAYVQQWVRSYTLEQRGGLVITDRFKLQEGNAPNVVNFMTSQRPDIAKPGMVALEVEGKKIRMTYDNSVFEPSVEEIALTDPRLSKVWGDKVFRLSLKARKVGLVGEYKFVVSL
jgi:Heparinase II/III-like protein.